MRPANYEKICSIASIEFSHFCQWHECNCISRNLNILETNAWIRRVIFIQSVITFSIFGKRMLMQWIIFWIAISKLVLWNTDIFENFRRSNCWMDGFWWLSKMLKKKKNTNENDIYEVIVKRMSQKRFSWKLWKLGMPCHVSAWFAK